MESKKNRDREANLEKEKLLNPEKVLARKKRRTKRIAIAAVSSAVLVAAAAAGSFQAVKAFGKNSLMGREEAGAPALAVQEKADPVTDEEKDEWQEGWVKYQGTVYAYNEDIMTFLIMGIDKNSTAKEEAGGTNGGQADALFLAVMNPHDKTIRVVGINRNTMTDIDIYNETGAYVTTTKAQIAVQHGYGNGMAESCEYQKKAVRKLFYDLPIHGYAAINMSAISTINDAVGGVDVTVLQDLTKVDKSLKEGAQVHLTGKSAYWYVKYRDTNEFASADMRLARQKQYLNAFIQKAKSAAKAKPSVVLELYRSISPQMVTDISMGEAAYLATALADYRFTDDSFYMMQGETVMGEKFEEFYPDETALYEMILDIFYEEVEKE